MKKCITAKTLVLSIEILKESEKDMIYRIFVEKKDNVQARKEQADIKTLLNIDAEDFRLVLRYDVEGLSEEELKAALGTVFSEPPVDDVYLENLEILI